MRPPEIPVPEISAPEIPAKTTDPLDAADLIARDIQSGALSPGMWLKQIDLAIRYHCSRPAIRRALDQLAEKRLVQHIANRGYYVYAPDDRKTAEILEIRGILEAAAADAIIANADAAAIARLDRLAHRFEAGISGATLIELYDTNLAFHHALLALCGNGELVELVGELRRRTSSAPASQWRARADVEASAREHHAMVAAIRAGDAGQLRQTILRHIRQYGRGGRLSAAGDPDAA